MSDQEPDLPWPARPRPIAVWGFDRYLRRLARRNFAGVHWSAVAGVSVPNHGFEREPLLVVANHTNWWDGFMACLLTRRLGLGFQVLMEAQHLARYRLFLRVGALPLRRTSPHAAYRDLTRARSSLVPGNALWVFPQGARRPATEPIAGIERGAAHLAVSAGHPVRVVPVAFRYPFAGEQRPEAFALVGEPWRVAGSGSRRRESDRIEGALRSTVAALDARMATEDFAGFEPLVHGRMSVNKRLDRLRHSAGLLRGEFEPRNG